MTVLSGTISAGPYIGDGVQREFPFEFPILDTRHVAVYLGGNRVDRGVTVTGGSDGGKVVFDVAPVKEMRIAILRDMPLTQEMDLQNNTAFLPEVLEAAFDRLVMIAQQLYENIGRAATYAPGMEGVTDIAATAYMAVEAAKTAALAAQETANALAELRQSQQAALAELASKSEAASQLANDAITRLTEKDTEVEAKYSQVSDMLAGAEILESDRTVNFADLPDPDPSGGDYAYMNWENTLRANVELLNTLPRNLGGHTLTLSFNGYQHSGDAPGLYLIDGFYNGKVVIQGNFLFDRWSVPESPLLRVKNCSCEVLFGNCVFRNASENSYAYNFILVENCKAVDFAGCSFSGKFYPGIDVDYPSGALILAANSDVAFNRDDEYYGMGWDSFDFGGNDVSQIEVPEHAAGKFLPVRFFDEKQSYFAKAKELSALQAKVTDLEERLNTK